MNVDYNPHHPEQINVMFKFWFYFFYFFAKTDIIITMNMLRFGENLALKLRAWRASSQSQF